MNNDEEIKAPDNELKERILKFIFSIPEPIMKAGMTLTFIIGLFILIWLMNFFLLGITPLYRAFTLALIEFAILTLFLMVPFLVYKILVKGERRIWFSFGKRRLGVKAGPEIYRAEMYQTKGDYSEAIKEYRKLFSLSPDRLDFLYAIAEIYRNDLKDNEKAVKTHMEVAKYDGDKKAIGYEYHISHSKDILKHTKE
ncbi:MAG: hypothetical protein JW984_03245 [Deltaproteobacteria bacterium]|uniref:Tetratricopeptide repeat protein n=1 Tax=Candidatus Zymogenus saltonus TaxID=2844893 RepID=A0A9D8PNQ8_9DELT|nr:hypothetical protein [Candidatus Zymogenus saltonus]